MGFATGGLGFFGKFLQGYGQGRMLKEGKAERIAAEKSKQKYLDLQAENLRLKNEREARQERYYDRYMAARGNGQQETVEPPQQLTPMGSSFNSFRELFDAAQNAPGQPLGVTDMMARRSLANEDPVIAEYLGLGGAQGRALTMERNKQLHEESTARLNEAIRKGDIAQAQYELNRLKAAGSYKTIETTGPSGEQQTTILPEYGMTPGTTFPKVPGKFDVKIGSGEMLNWYKPGNLTNLQQPVPEKQALSQGYVNVTDPTKKAELNLVRDMRFMIDKLIAGAKPDYVSGKGLARSAARQYGGLVPGLKQGVETFIGKDPKYAGWSMLFNRIKALERHEMFGSAFTSTEKAAFRQAFPAEIQDYESFIEGLKVFKKVLENKGYLMLGQTPPGQAPTGQTQSGGKSLINEMDEAIK